MGSSPALPRKILRRGVLAGKRVASGPGRKLVAGFLVVWLLILARPMLGTAQTPATAGPVTVISPDGLNLRQAPSMSAPVLDIVPFAAVLSVTGSPTADRWYPVAWGTKSGWANGDFLAAGSLAPDAAKNATSLTGAAAAALSTTASPLSLIVPPAAPPAIASSTSGPPSSAATAPYRATATYYGVDDGATAGKIMACGAPFDPMNGHAAATNDWNCGTKLRITAGSGKSVEVTVADHGMYPAHWIDLTYAAFGQIADHRIGNIQVTVEVLP